MDYLTIANAPVFWGLCGITVVISLAQALLFMRQATRTSVQVGLDNGLAKQAFKIGLISAIGPACGVFIVMVGLMASIGGPMAWLRLSIIGAAATELSAATMGAQAAGVEFGGKGYDLTVMAVSWFAMALNGAGWLLVSGTVTPALEKLRGKLSGGDAKWLAVLSGACSLGIFGYLNANEIKKRFRKHRCLSGRRVKHGGNHEMDRSEASETGGVFPGNRDDHRYGVCSDP